MASLRTEEANYTTSGRNGGKSSVIKKAPAKVAKKAASVKKAAPAAKPAAKSKFPSSLSAKLPASMSVPGSARPGSATKPSASKIPSVPAFGRDRLGTSKFFGSPSAKAPQNRPGINRQEVEAGVMSKMRRDRLGPGQQ